MFNMRISDDLLALMDEAVEAARASDRSTWARGALEVSALAEIREACVVGAIPVSGVHRDGTMQTTMIHPSGCQHPPTGHRRSPHRLFCGVCGTTLRSLL